MFVNARRGAERLCARLNELAAGARDRPGRGRDDRHRPSAGRGDGPVRHRGRGRAAGRPRPPRLGLPRGAQAHRGGAQGRPAAGRRRHQQPRTRHRHGRGRPGHPGRGAAQRRGRAAAGRPGRAPGRRGLPRRGLPEAPRRPGLLRGGRRADGHRRRSRSCATRATRSTCWPSRSSRWSRWSRGTVADLAALVRRAAPFAELPASALDAVLDMLSGRYPSTAFAELRPRLVWDRVDDTLTGRPGAQRLAVTSGGTIPDRGLFGVFLAGSERASAGRRAGRGDGLRVARRRRLPARLDVLADRGHHPRPRPGLPRARRRRADAVLEGRRARPPGRTRPGDRRPAARADQGGRRRGARVADRRRPGRLGRRQPARLPGRAARRHPGRCPTTGRSWSNGSATSSATGG